MKLSMLAPCIFYSCIFLFRIFFCLFVCWFCCFFAFIAFIALPPSNSLILATRFVSHTYRYPCVIRYNTYPTTCHIHIAVHTIKQGKKTIAQQRVRYWLRYNMEAHCGIFFQQFHLILLPEIQKLHIFRFGTFIIIRLSTAETKQKKN